MNDSFVLDGEEVAFAAGQTVIQAARTAGKYIPHLCWHPDFAAHGSCKLCTVKINGRFVSSCTALAAADMLVENRTPELDDKRRTLLQLLFVEGNHFCPSCEKSGNCSLQATAYAMGMEGPHFEELYPDRPVDATHPDLLLDLNRCILCGLCVRASEQADHKSVFAIGGHGIHTHLLVNSPSGKLVDSALLPTDRAADICPTGVILHKRRGFVIPIGQRQFDAKPISEQVEGSAP